MDIYDYRTFTIENNDPNPPRINTLDSMNLQNNHCQKCGRRNKSEYRRGRMKKCKRQQRLFPTEFPPHPPITQTNANYCHSMSNNILIDQFIQVQQLNATRCNSQSYDTDENRIFTEKNYKSQRVQQMMYLRENINNLTYRELHFPNEYIILKRLEEKNHLINQNHINVDHYFRSFKLHTLYQNIPIKSFIYTKQDISIQQSNDKSLPATIEMNDTITVKSTDDQTPETLNRNSSSIDPISTTPYNVYTQPQYSRNATQDFIFDTAVTVDVAKCSQYKQKINKRKTKHSHQPFIQSNWNHVRSTCSMPILVNNQQESTPMYIPNQMIYFDQFADFYQQQLSVDSIFYNPMNQYFIPAHFKESNELQSLTNFPDNSHDMNITSPVYQTSPSNSSDQKSLSFTNSDTTTNISNEEKNCTEPIDKIKKVLSILKKNLLAKLLCNNKKLNNSTQIKQTSTNINKSISTSMTSDSLISNTSIQTTYSVSSTVPILNKKISQLSLKTDQKHISTINVENELSQIELDSLNNNHSNRTKFQTILRNGARNINRNQQTSDEDLSYFTSDYTRSRSKRPISHCITIRYMSPSFMFVLQLLLITCLINRILMYYFVGIVPADTLTLSTFASETEQTTNVEIFNTFFSSLFKLVYS